MSDPAPRVAITAEISQADPATCKFTVDAPVHTGRRRAFGVDDAVGSPLATRLFTLDHVRQVVIGDRTVSVTRAPDANWDDMKRPIAAAIRAHLASGQPAVGSSDGQPGSTGGRRNDDEIREAIEELLERDVNPAIASHGGRISVVEVRDGNLLIAMSGGCQGCASSSATLRNGFEAKARLVAPELGDIIDTTDHAAGTSPFYSLAAPTRRPSPLEA
jgi:NFU1 iron-sulfur cluster scaffold homolog, mitochondrial